MLETSAGSPLIYGTVSFAILSNPVMIAHIEYKKPPAILLGGDL